MPEEAWDEISRPVMRELSEAARIIKQQPLRGSGARPQRPVLTRNRIKETDIGSGSPAAGCCDGCLDCGILVIDGFYADIYVITGIHSAFRPPDTDHLEVHYVGLDGSGHYVWESAGFEYVCVGGTDNYFWRMVNEANGNGGCKSEGSEVVSLFLVREGSAAICEDLTDANCNTACLGGSDCCSNPPASFTVTFDTPDCAALDGKSYTFTRFGAPGSYGYASSGAIPLLCVETNYSLQATLGFDCDPEANDYTFDFRISINGVWQAMTGAVVVPCGELPATAPITTSGGSINNACCSSVNTSPIGNVIISG